MKKRIGYFCTAVLFLLTLTLGAAADAAQFGDANRDGSLDMKDVLIVRKYIANLIPSVDSLSDTNGDGVIDMKDVLIMRKTIANLYPNTESKRDVDVSTLPESLAAFLNHFSYGYVNFPGNYDSEFAKVYDAAHISDGQSNILTSIVRHPTCVDFSIYPGTAPIEHWDETDPRGWSNMGSYAELDEATVNWIARNIFNATDADLRKLQQQGEEQKWFYRQIASDGNMHYYLPIGGIGGPFEYVTLLTSAQFDGTRYYVTYDYYYLLDHTDAGYVGSYYAELEYRNIGGTYYWSLLYYQKQSAAHTYWNSAIQAYKQFVYANPHNDEWNYTIEQFALFDLNADGTPELFTRGGGQMDYNKIFTFKNGKVEMVHWGTSFSLLDNGIVYVQFSSGMGYNLYSYYGLNEQLDMTLVFRYAEWMSMNETSYSIGEDAYKETAERVPYRAVQRERDTIVGAAKAISINYHELNDFDAWTQYQKTFR